MGKAKKVSLFAAQLYKQLEGRRHNGQERYVKSCTPLFIAALLTLAKKWKQPNFPLTDGRMNKQNVVYMYNGILFCLKREGKSDTCPNVDKP